MRLTQTELDRLTIFTAAELARRRRSRGVRLNHPEAVALICDELHEAARLGAAYADVVALGEGLLTVDDVLDGVADMITSINVECLFADGMRLVTIERPIGPAADGLHPGELLLDGAPVELYAARERVEVMVENSSDHTIFISSHYPFFEVNRRLIFDRAQAWGRHLDLPAGDAERWLPGERKRVRLVPFTGERLVRGFNSLSDGPTTLERLPAALARLGEAGYEQRAEGNGD